MPRVGARSTDLRHELHRGGHILFRVPLRRLQLAVAENRLNDIQPVPPQFRRPAVSQLIRMPAMLPPPGPYRLPLLGSQTHAPGGDTFSLAVVQSARGKMFGQRKSPVAGAIDGVAVTQGDIPLA